MNGPVARLAKDGEVIDFTTKEISENLKAYLEIRNNFEYAHDLAKKKLGIATTTACRAGCTWCCTHDQPNLTPPEAIALIELCCRDKALEDVLDKALAHLAWVKEQLKTPPVVDQVGHPMMQCIFLGENGRCRIYKQRPIACVATFSVSAKACEASAIDKSRKAWTADPETTIRLLMKMRDYLPAERLEAVVDWAVNQKDEGNAVALNFGIATLVENATKEEK